MCKEQRYCQGASDKQDGGGNEENRISTTAQPGLVESGKLFRGLESCSGPGTLSPQLSSLVCAH